MKTRTHLFGCRAASTLTITSALLIALHCPATNRTWTGSSGIDLNWMTPGNWQGVVAPSPGDSLTFNGAAMGGNNTNHNNYPDGTTFGSIAINTATSQDFQIGGNRVVLTNGISETVGGVFNQLAGFVYFNVTLGADQNFTAGHSLVLNNTTDTDGHQITVNGAGVTTFNGALLNSSISEGSSIIKTNTGTLSFSSTATIASTNALNVVLSQGTIQMNGVASNADFELGQGTFNLDGIGHFIDVTGPVSISGTGIAAEFFFDLGATGGTCTPGDNGAPGVLQCGYLINESFGAATLQIKVNSTTPGTGYSQVLVYSNYSLGNEALAVQWGYTPQIGDSFQVLALESDIPYLIQSNHYFVDLPPKCIYDATNGSSLAVLYNSNGVTLSTIRTSASPFVLWKGSSISGLSGSTYESSDWSNTNNWAQGVPPTSGSSVVFSPYQLILYDAAFERIPAPPMTNDLAAGLTLSALWFSGSNYVLYGNPLTISGSISNSSTGGTNSCFVDIATAGAVTLDVESGGSLLLDDSIAGSGTISKEGGGALIYTGTTMDEYVGTAVVDNGTLQVDGSFTDGSFTINGGLLKGTGTISAVTMTGGTLKPGDSPGVFHIQGDLAMAPGAVFESELNGPIPGSGYGQLQVNGNISLNGATLNLQPNFAASVGAAFLILVNQGTSPIAGTFSGLPQGAIFEAGGQFFSISYQAGSGNKNVLVTRVNPPGNLTGIQSLSPTAVQLLGTGATNGTYNILANTNLATTNWVNLGTVNANSSGFFFFNDSNVLTFPQRFYEVQ